MENNRQGSEHQEDILSAIEHAWLGAMDNELCEVPTSVLDREYEAMQNIISSADIYASDYGVNYAEFRSYAERKL